MSIDINIKANARQPHTLPSRSNQPHNPKLVNKCVFLNARTKKKALPTTLYKRNAGEVAKI